MTHWAKPGAKCVCIEDGDWLPVDNIAGMEGPAISEICTVTGVFADNDGIWITLAGYLDDDGFCLSSFRPLITKTQEQDVALFAPLLTKQEEPA